jgi:hypothetical protein
LQDNPSCNGGNDGRINLIVSMGASPYNFKWSNGATSKDLTNLTAGSYSVEVTDANNCSVKASTTISEPAAFTATAAGTPSCAGTPTGTATVSINGGTGPYIYKWSNGSGDQNISNLESGTYTVIVTDASKCSATSSVNVTPLAAINITSATTSPACHGMSNGNINITVTGGLSPYTYLWSNGATSQDINNIAAGSYTVTVKDMRNCSASVNVTLNEPSILTASSSINESSATIAANGGTPPYAYSWSNGLSGSSQSNLQNGSYTVNVTDANNCTASATATINVIPEEKITICHQTGSGTITIDIAASALSAHLAHGDQIGACAPPTPVVEETVTICHIPPGNPDNPQTITIPKSALPAHLAHGDQMGTCVPKAVTNPDNNTTEEQITICHIPPGNPDNPQTITIPKSALPAHLAHGDQVGVCIAKPVNDNTDDKITICHIPPGDPNNPQSISISRSALAAHLAHGDHIGECVAEDTKNNSGNNTQTANNNDANDKITICHIPPGNPNNPQTISISRSALPAHLAHGDQVGDCPPQNNSDADKQKQKDLDDQAAKQKAIDDQAEKDRQQKALNDQADQANKQKVLDDQAEQARKQKALDDQAEQVRKQKALDDQAEQARKQKELDDQAEQARKQKELDDQASQQLKQKGIDDDQAAKDRQQKALDDQAERDRQQKALDDQAEKDRQQKALDDQAAKDRQQKALDDQAERDRQQKVLDDQAEKDRQQKALDDQAEKDRQQKALDDQAEKDRQQKALDDQAEKDRQKKIQDDQAEKDRQQKALDDQAEKDRQQKALDDQAEKDRQQKARDDQAEKDRQQKILDDQAEKDRQQKILDDQKKQQQPDGGGK